MPRPFSVAGVVVPELLPVGDVKLAAAAAAPDVDGVGDASVLPSFFSTLKAEAIFVLLLLLAFKLLLLLSNVVLEALIDVLLIVTAFVEELLLAEDEDALLESLSISSVT